MRDEPLCCLLGGRDGARWGHVEKFSTVTTISAPDVGHRVWSGNSQCQLTSLNPATPQRGSENALICQQKILGHY